MRVTVAYGHNPGRKPQKQSYFAACLCAFSWERLETKPDYLPELHTNMEKVEQIFPSI